MSSRECGEDKKNENPFTAIFGNGERSKTSEAGQLNESQVSLEDSAIPLKSTGSEDSTITIDFRGALQSLEHAQSSAGTSSTQDPSTPNRASKRKRNSKSNPPSAYRGVRMADNPKHTLTSLAEVGKPDESKLRFKLQMVGGGYTKAFRFEGRKNPQWDNQEWVDALNKWRTKTLKRYFTTEDTAPKSNKTGPRVRWSYAELEHLRMQIRKTVRSTGSSLSGKDWKKITEHHNERFQGKTVKTGERLANGKVAATDRVIERRTQAAITSIYGKVDDLKQIMQEEINAFGTEVSNEGAGSYKSSSDSDTSGDSDSNNEVENGGFDNILEESSDEEDEGRRLVGHPVGGVPVEMAS